MNSSPAFITLTKNGFDLAQKISAEMGVGDVFALKKRVPDADHVFEDTMAQIRDLFQAGRPIVGVCASAILVRALAPVLSDKMSEPPVLSLAEDGSCCVPILGGHHGANELASWIGDLLDCPAAITTAGDLSFGVALDDPPIGWHVHNPEAAKEVAATLLAGNPVGLINEAGSSDWLENEGIEFEKDASPSIQITVKTDGHQENALVYHPPVLALGVGCHRDCPSEHLIDHVMKVLADNHLSPKSVACVVSIDVKADEEAVHAVANYLGVPARFYDAETLEQETTRLENPSDVVFAEVGCHGVSEGAALASVGSSGKLIVPKTKTEQATCAIAQSIDDITPSLLGTSQGHLSVIGIGPGSDEWRSPQATTALRKASDVVGYGLYLDLIEDQIVGKERHESGLANEEKRARIALDLAAQGKRVCLVCSGDAGIYALATLVFELLDREDNSSWNRLKIEVAPGISALQACAARIGAPINHDFCTISLSDLLTPWEDIERRLKAAADGDFVVAFYNPRSKRRVTQIEQARDILLTGRAADTPVVLGRNLGRETEELKVITLGELTSDHADMLTMVLVGSSQSRDITRGQNQWVYTPRGYARKMKGGDKA